ncbi:MAG: glycosyltransferase family 9 protein [Candidatus Eremiobacterota bacterium]
MFIKSLLRPLITYIKRLKNIIIHCDNLEIFFDSLEISGWVVSNKTIERIEIYFEAQFLGNARYGQARPDVALAYPSVQKSGCSGFTFVHELKGLKDGRIYRVIIKAVTETGHSASINKKILFRGNMSFRERFIKRNTSSAADLCWINNISKKISGTISAEHITCLQREYAEPAVYEQLILEDPVYIKHYEPFLDETFRPPDVKGIKAESIKKILLVKLDHIGDVILGLPAIKILRRKFPDSHITVLCGPWAKPLLETVKEIDNIICFNFFHEKSEKGEKFLEKTELEILKETLLSMNFDLAIDLRRFSDTREILNISGAVYKAGYSSKDCSVSLNISLNGDILKDVPRQLWKPHISVQLCELIMSVPSVHTINYEYILPELSFEEDIPEDIKSIIMETSFIAAIHPGSGTTMRCWPPSYFAALIDLLAKKYKGKIFLFGGKEEINLIEEIMALSVYKDNVISLAGILDLKQFMSVLKHCNIFIGNNSGPGHIAGVLGVPLLIIFSGHVLPHEWQPYGEKSLVIYRDTFCSPCYKLLPEDCPFDLKCLKKISPEKVLDGIGEVLAVSGQRAL